MRTFAGWRILWRVGRPHSSSTPLSSPLCGGRLVALAVRVAAQSEAELEEALDRLVAEATHRYLAERAGLGDPLVDPDPAPADPEAESDEDTDPLDAGGCGSAENPLGRKM